MSELSNKLLRKAAYEANYRACVARRKGETFDKQGEELERASYDDRYSETIRNAVGSVARRKYNASLNCKARSSKYLEASIEIANLIK